MSEIEMAVSSINSIFYGTIGEQKVQSSLTRMKTARNFPTSPGGDCHVPRPTHGIFAPELSVE
jgi:hypothetical protein